MRKYTVCAMTGGDLEGVPSEIKLIPLGTIKSQKGTFWADEESFRLIKERFENRKLDLVIDYEHQTLKDVQAPDGSRICAWGKMQLLQRWIGRNGRRNT